MHAVFAKPNTMLALRYAPPNLNPLASLEAHKREAARLQCGWFCTEVRLLSPLLELSSSEPATDGQQRVL